MPETFEERYREAFRAIRPSEESLARLSEKLRAARPEAARKQAARPRRRALRYAALTLSFAAVAALVFYPPAREIPSLKTGENAVRTDVSQAASPSASSSSAASYKASTTAGDYAGLFAQLGKPQERSAVKGGSLGAQNFSAAQNAPEAGMAAANAASADGASASSAPTSGASQSGASQSGASQSGASGGGGLSTAAEQPPAATDPNLLAAGVAYANYTAQADGIVYALTQQTDGAVSVTAVSAAGKQSHVLAKISCDTALAEYTSLFPAMGGTVYKTVAGPDFKPGTKWADYRPVALYAENGRLAVAAQYGATYFSNGAAALIYDVTDPAAPKLLQSYAQCGSYTGSREEDGALYLTSSYTPASPSGSNPESFVPQVFENGVRSLLPLAAIAVRKAGESAYAVAQAVRLTGSPARIYACAVLGGGDAVWAGPKNLLLAQSAERTVSSTTTYGNWVQVPREKQTAKTGSRLRYKWVTTLTTADENFSLYTLQNGSPALQATGTLPGALDADGVAEQEGRFILVTESSENQESGGCFVNESGAQVDYAGGGIPDPPAYYGKPPETSLYVLDAASLARVGTLLGITSEWADSISFAQNRCTLQTQDGPYTVDFSNPAAPRLLR